MIREEILAKLTEELYTVLTTVNEDPRELICIYINYALDIGSNHLYKDAKEVAKLDEYGNIINIYRSAADAAEKNGLSEGNIKSVIFGRRHQTGGFGWKQLTA